MQRTNNRTKLRKFFGTSPPDNGAVRSAHSEPDHVK